MADKSISELIAATQITESDLFVLEQSGTAKKMTGQIFVNWLTHYADGHGGIQSITKTTTAGLVDTYRITFADTDAVTFTVTNGKGISSITQYWAVSASNSTVPSSWQTTRQTMTTTNRYLWSYMRIAYNDGSYTDTTKSVVGVYGDTGAQTYVWIKYSAIEPTSDADMGDNPDNWIGIYYGTASSAPISRTSYTWYQYKGEKGETGDPATLNSASVSYQQSDSGSVVPDGAWQVLVPQPVNGKYLWTRVILTFNTGSPITYYSVARYGIDGSGAVSTVNGLSPDVNGNITVSASDIQMQDSTSVEANIGTIQTNLITREKSQLYNKKFLVIGDSWCSSWDGTQDLTPWATRLATNTGAITENHAFPGSGFVAKGQLNKDFSEAIQLYPGGDYDAIIVQGGVNDISSDPSDNTIATAVSNFATTCRTMYPNVDIYYIATAPCKNLTSNETRIVSALTQNAKVNYITVCTDLLDIGSVDTSYQGDTTHLSDAGYSEFARCVAQFLTGGTAKPKKGFLYAPSYTQIYPRTTVSSTGSVTLSASVDAFDAVIVFVYNGSGTADRKSFFIPSIGYGGRSDVSWNATDSTSWYAIITLTFSGTSMNVNKCEISGFSAIQVSVYGVKFRV